MILNLLFLDAFQLYIRLDSNNPTGFYGLYPKYPSDGNWPVASKGGVSCAAVNGDGNGGNTADNYLYLDVYDTPDNPAGTMWVDFLVYMEAATFNQVYNVAWDGYWGDYSPVDNGLRANTGVLNKWVPKSVLLPSFRPDGGENDASDMRIDAGSTSVPIYVSWVSLTSLEPVDYTALEDFSSDPNWYQLEGNIPFYGATVVSSSLGNSLKIKMGDNSAGWYCVVGNETVSTNKYNLWNLCSDDGILGYPIVPAGIFFRVRKVSGNFNYQVKVRIVDDNGVQFNFHSKKIENPEYTIYGCSWTDINEDFSGGGNNFTWGPNVRFRALEFDPDGAGGTGEVEVNTVYLKKYWSFTYFDMLPENGADVTVRPALRWRSRWDENILPSEETYLIVASDPSFKNIVIKQKVDNEGYLDVSSLPSGVYWWMLLKVFDATSVLQGHWGGSPRRIISRSDVKFFTIGHSSITVEAQKISFTRDIMARLGEPNGGNFDGSHAFGADTLPCGCWTWKGVEAFHFPEDDQNNAFDFEGDSKLVFDVPDGAFAAVVLGSATCGNKYIRINGKEYRFFDWFAPDESTAEQKFFVFSDYWVESSTGAITSGADARFGFTVALYFLPENERTLLVEADDSGDNGKNAVVVAVSFLVFDGFSASLRASTPVDISSLFNHPAFAYEGDFNATSFSEDGYLFPRNLVPESISYGPVLFSFQEVGGERGCLRCDGQVLDLQCDGVGAVFASSNGNVSSAVLGYVSDSLAYLAPFTAYVYNSSGSYLIKAVDFAYLLKVDNETHTVTRTQKSGGLFAGYWMFPSSVAKIYLPKCSDVKVFTISALRGAFPEGENTQPIVFIKEGPASSIDVARIEIPSGSEDVEVIVYTEEGFPVRHIFKGEVSGNLVLSWSGQDDTGRFLPSGLYVIKVKIGKKVEKRLVALIRRF